MTRQQRLLYRQFRTNCGKGIRVLIPFINNDCPNYLKKLQKWEESSRNCNSGVIVR